jgi:16S rRNA processing protein RimM
MLASELESAQLPADAVEVGRILDAWGVQGELKILPYSALPEVLFSSKRWFLQPPERGPKAFTGTALLRVRAVKQHNNIIVARAPDIPDRTSALTLKGARVFVPRSAFPSLAEGEYYWVDLIGLAVINREGQQLGNVTDLISTGPQQVLVAGYEQAGKQQNRLIPFVSAYVDEVDLSARRITVDWQLDY